VDYDNANRPTVYSYPDGTYQQLVYNNLDLAATRDRLGRWTRKFYDPLRRVVAVIDPLWRTTQFQYCVCGALENLIDPLGNTTSWSHDLEGRVTAKTYADNTSVQYTYENTTSRLKQMTDAMSQMTVYTNNIDNTLAGVSYLNAVVATAPVSFTYDSNYNRVLTMVDTNGTTTYTYNPSTNTVLGAGRLASVAVPLSNNTATITYSYDQLGRVLNRAINNVTNAVAYDSLGRVMIVSNVLGVFTNTYVGVTARLSTMTYPNGQLLTNTYFGNTGDERLQEILNQGTNTSTISKFDYTYDAEGEIQTWSQQTNTAPSSVYNFQYDAASQLVEALQSGAVVNTNEYAYDAAGNRLSERTNNVVEGAAYNNVNELVGQSGTNGQLRFRGSVNEPISNATVAGSAAMLDSGTNFTGYATVSPGSNTVQVAVSDFNGNTVANYYSVVLSNGASQTLTYDLNGNLVSMTNTTTGASMSNVWDAANRLVAIYSNGTYESVFTYDGLGRRVRQTEISGTTTNTDYWMLWCGSELCEELSGASVHRRYFSQGEEFAPSGKYYFTRDHLGSIREMTDSTGAIRAQYSYDPWGRQTLVAGVALADLGFTGHYYHAPSGLDLTLYRAYSADLGRWLNRDPIGEPGFEMLRKAHRNAGGLFREESLTFADGPNLYFYGANNPVSESDPFGLTTKAECDAQYEQDCDVCRNMKGSGAKKAACWAKAMAWYADCLATAAEEKCLDAAAKHPAETTIIIIIIIADPPAAVAF
jgi:RHS repeat-associated protein